MSWNTIEASRLNHKKTEMKKEKKKQYFLIEIYVGIAYTFWSFTFKEYPQLYKKQNQLPFWNA